MEVIQKEIMVYGPVQAGFTVYTDFLSYKSGNIGYYNNTYYAFSFSSNYFVVCFPDYWPK